MSYDEFFTDSDKPYAENLNDSMLLLDAFDIVVPVEMPAMFNNGEFSSTANVARKCGVGIVTLKSVSSGVTIGTNSISGSGTVVFRVYPNFNAFYKWKSIELTKTGTVDISFKKTDGTGIGATVNSSGIISEVNALKTLQEIDVVLTLTSATINRILIQFINNTTNTRRTGALLDANQLTNVNGEVATGNTKAVSGGTVKNALNSIMSTIQSALDLKEVIANKVNNLDVSTDHYPTTLAVRQGLETKANKEHSHLAADITNLGIVMYPVGSIYLSVNNVDPGLYFGGTWEKIEGKFLLASSSSYSLGSTGGSKDAVVVSHNHTQNGHRHGTGNDRYFLTSEDIISVNGTKRNFPSESSSGSYLIYSGSKHGIYRKEDTGSSTATNNSTGVSGTGKNMPPYLVVSVWKRTAL